MGARQLPKTPTRPGNGRFAGRVVEFSDRREDQGIAFFKFLLTFASSEMPLPIFHGGAFRLACRSSGWKDTSSRR